MSDLLFIKTSSLGDVIHHMPAITDVRRHRPDARVTWLVEEPFAALVRLHGGVDAIIPVAARRWRKEAYAAATWREIAAFVREVRKRSYDAVIDTQGLMRSALIARVARGRRHGYDRRSIREPVASVVYDVRHTVARDLHAIDRNRRLAALALGYTVEGPPDYGLDRGRLAGTPSANYAVLLHATAQERKQWPEEHWIGLGRALSARGLDVVIPWGTEAERLRSERLAASLPGSRVFARQPLDAVARLIAGASLVVGVDTGLVHLAAALAVPLVAIFVHSEPQLTGPVGVGPMAVCGRSGTVPSLDEVLAAVDRVNA